VMLPSLWPDRRGGGHQDAIDLPGYVALFRQRTISRLLLPPAVRLATYSLVRRSRPIRTMQIIYNARLASRLPT
jgi:hypothetical protein